MYLFAGQASSSGMHFPLTAFSAELRQLIQAPFVRFHSLHLASTLSQVQVALLKKVLPVQFNEALSQTALALRVYPAEHLVHLVKSL